MLQHKEKLRKMVSLKEKNSINIKNRSIHAPFWYLTAKD